jgi:two-component system response regulator NreC
VLSEVNRCEESRIIRVIIADDHPIIRSGLRQLLMRQPDIEVAGEAADGAEAVRLASLVRPNVAILDLEMPHMNGLEAARRISVEAADTRIVFFTMHSTEEYLRECLLSGARGYLLKDASETEIITAIRVVHGGRAYLSPDVSRTMANGIVRRLNEASDDYDLLSTREREILQLLAEGNSNKEIATTLNVAVCTIESHRNSIFKKLNLHSVPQLMLYAVRKGLIT